jgi:hypothetical protein
VGAGGDLGHHPAERGVLLELGADDRRQHLDAAVLVPAHDGRGGLVAAGFQSEDGEAHFLKGVIWLRGFAAPVAAKASFDLAGNVRTLSRQPIRIGARGSKLSLAQSGLMQARIAAALGWAVPATTSTPSPS